MDWVGLFEPTTSAMPAFQDGHVLSIYRTGMKREIHTVQTPTRSTICFLRLRLTVHGYGPKNSASKHASNLFKVLIGQEKKRRMSFLNCMYRMRRRKDL
jgi:hypothetical protein